MCGIAGVLAAGAGRREGELAAAVTAMAARMVHRGPDGSGHWVDAAAGVALSHRRLSVVDLSDHGAQPMSSRDGRWVLTYNGEIYGHRELAAELAAGGVALRGHSDTEVLDTQAKADSSIREALDLIEKGLGEMSDRQIVPTSEVADLLLDVRSVLAKLDAEVSTN